MAKADRAPIVMYRAFCPSAGETVDQGHDWGARDVAAAARLQVTMLWRKGWKTTNWPVLVYVIDPSEDKTYEVLVSCSMHPVFDVVGTPTETGK